MIRKQGGKFIIFSKKGKRLGEYASRAEAEKRLRQIEYFKHVNEEERSAFREQFEAAQAEGKTSQEAFAEAFASVAEALSPDSMESVAAHVRKAYYATEGQGAMSALVTDVFEDYVIVQDYNDNTYEKVPYTWNDAGDPEFGDGTPVDLQFVEVNEAMDEDSVMESTDPVGAVWKARILKFGLSKNGWVWTREAAEQMLPMLANAPIGCYVYDGRMTHAKEEDINKAGGPVTRNVVGDVQDPWIEEDGLYGNVHIHEDAGWLRTKLMNLEKRGVVDKVLGLSVDTLCGFVPVMVQEVAARMIKQVKRVVSVDVVTAPSADGRLLRATAGPLPEENMMDKKALLAIIKEHRPKLLEGRSAEQIEKLTDEELQALVREALKEPSKKESEPAKKDDGKPQWMKDMEVRESQLRVTEALDATKLPAPVKAKVAKRFAGQVVEQSVIDAVVKEEVDTLGALSKTGDIKGVGGGKVEIVAAEIDKIQVAVDRMFGVTPDAFIAAAEKIPASAERIAMVKESVAPLREAAKDPGLQFRSIREFYEYMTGDRFVTGIIDRKAARVTESIESATWPNILGNTLYRRLLMDYAAPQYNERAIAEFGSAADFRTKENVNLKYFGDLDVVDPEVADYVEIGAVGDEKTTYSVGQRGNLLTITRKTIINDDLRAVSRLVGRLGRAARRTLAKYVWSFWINNTAYGVDSDAWFHSNHANTNSTALTADANGATAVNAAILQLANMTEPGSGEKLGFPELGSLWLDVPVALWAIAQKINDSPEWGAGVANMAYKRFGQGGERINANPLFTDATDWGVHVAPGTSGREAILVDFLQGREEPEFFLADAPTVGQAFVADKIQYKVRHEYGGVIVDFRSAVKNVVA